MSNIDLPIFLQDANLLLDFVLKIASIFFAIYIAWWYKKQLNKLSDLEEKMRVHSDLINGGLAEKFKKIKNGMVSQPVYEGRLARDTKIEQEAYNKLDRERHFILDKLPFTSIFKR